MIVWFIHMFVWWLEEKRESGPIERPNATTTEASGVTEIILLELFDTRRWSCLAGRHLHLVPVEPLGHRFGRHFGLFGFPIWLFNGA